MKSLFSDKEEDDAIVKEYGDIGEIEGDGKPRMKYLLTWEANQ